MSPREAFAADWLSLREAIDHRSRPVRLTQRLEAALPPGERRIIDLGAGHGSNLRYLAPRLGGRQRWLLIDHDADLLERALANRPEQAGLVVESRLADLADLADLTRPDIGRVDLVTASALLDLVSADWITTLADCLARWSAAALISLSVDGRRGFIDGDGQDCNQAIDQAMAAAFNQHQCQDKGLGAALGAQAAPALASALDALAAPRDYQVELARSDWCLEAGHADSAALACELLEGWAAAVAELDPMSADRIERWRACRLARIERGEIGLRVGHLDLLALPRSGARS